MKRDHFHTIYSWIGIFSIITIVKQYIVQALLGMPFMDIPYWLINVVIVIGIFTLASSVLSLKQYRQGLFCVYIFLTILMYGDLIHYRHFRTPIPIHSMGSAGQVAAVGGSVWVLLSYIDIVLFVDLIILGIYLYRSKRKSEEIYYKRRLFYGIAGIGIFCLVLLINTGMMKEGVYTAERLGMIYYHFVDIQMWVTGGESQVEDWEPKDQKTRLPVGQRAYFGAAKGRNLIVIQVESMQNFVLNREIEGQSITPVMNELISQDTLYFDRYYQQLGRGNTSDAEFVTHNSLYPSMGTYTYKQYEEHDFYPLPRMLQEQGYSTIAFHGNDPDFWNRRAMYKKQGFDTFISDQQMVNDEVIGIGISDGSVFRQSIPYLQGLSQPFYSFYVTLTSHTPFIMPKELQGLSCKGELKGTFLENYLQSIHYYDQVLGEFLESLKKQGLYENSIIVIYGDHFGVDIRKKEIRQMMSEFLEKPYDFDEFMNVGLLIHIPGLGKAETRSIAGGQIDFYPTMLNLLGVEQTKGYLFGQDLLNASKGFAASQTYMIKGSFIDDEKVFEMSRDGKYENSRAYYIHNGEQVPLEKCREGYERALQDINRSNYILHNNLMLAAQEKSPTNSSHFSDIRNQWAEEMINTLHEDGILVPTMDGLCKPEEPISRAEWITMMGRMYDWVQQEGQEYRDLNKEYAKPYIRVALERGIVPQDIDLEEPIVYDEALQWLMQVEAVRINRKDIPTDRVLLRGEAVEILYIQKYNDPIDRGMDR